MLAVLLSRGKAEVVTAWSIAANQTVLSTASTPPEANRMLAIVQTSVYGAANATAKR